MNIVILPMTEYLLRVVLALENLNFVGNGMVLNPDPAVAGIVPNFVAAFRLARSAVCYFITAT